VAQQTQINGNRYSFTSISVSANGEDQPKGVFKSINYKGTQQPGEVEGNQVVSVGLTSGYGKGSGDFEMLVSEFDDLAASLTNNGSVPLMSVDFDITVAYSVNDVDVRSDILRGCRITDLDSSNQSGTDASTAKAQLYIRRLTRRTSNGVEIDLFADPST
jgi:hypothetical protein